MASAALLATSCSQFSLAQLDATARGAFNCSSGVASPSSYSYSAHLNSSHQSPFKGHQNCRRSQFCGERISHSPRLLSGLVSSHSCPRVRARFGRVHHFSRHVSGLGSKEYVTALPTCFGRDRGTASVVCRGAATTVADIVTLKPFLDKLMLLGTVMYYYIAGVSALPRVPELVPGGKRVSSAAPRISASAQKRVKKKPVLQPPKPRQQVSNEDTWLALDSKLSSALSQEESEVEEQHPSNPMLSLQACARGPRQYLLFTTLHHLRKEVEDIAEAGQDLSLSEWGDLSLVVLCRTVLPVCRDWVSQDFSVMNQSLDAAKGFQFAGPATAGEGSEIISLTQSQVLDRMTNFLKDTDSVRTYLTRSGKAELYADLIFFLRFGSIRTGGCCDYRSFARFAGSALEDMVVVIAEVVATLFLDSCSSVVTLSPQSDTWQAFLLPSILSTRSLERFRNEVALSGWLNQNFASVVAMFEDRFDLWAFQRRPIPSADKEKQVKARKPQNDETSPGLLLTRVQLPARRSDELKALTGWRYYYSLYLEFSDVVGPILGMLLTRLGEAVSFLLVRLIGRSLGLVYQGIRQSVRWSPK